MKQIKKVKTRRNKRINAIIAILIFSIVFIFSFLIYQLYTNIEINESNYTAVKTNLQDSEATVKSEEEKSQTIADMIEKTTESVVGISKLKNAGTSILTGVSEGELGLGSGIIVTSNGYILSNEHVTGVKYSKCYITLEDGKNYEGTVEWSDSDLDLSITKIKAENLHYIKLGDSSNVKVGETVYAIGNPIGYEFRRTVTSGIISAKDRTIKIDESNKVSYMSNLIQTDATINPGNSGGPLIYSNGEIIGINTVKITSAEGIGFAVPINVVKNVIKSFQESESFEEATIGIYAYDSTATQYLEEKSNVRSRKGIYVDQVIKGGPASETELAKGDIITSIDGKELKTVNDLREYIFTKKPGEEVKIQINRGKINKEIKIVLGKK